MEIFSPLIELLKQYDKEYYNNGSPTVTDTEYDAFKETVRNKYPDHPYFGTVGATIDSGKKVRLPFILGSLDKVKTESVEKWATKYRELVASYKLDGISIMCIWENGTVVFASTRGDGKEGQDITEKAKIFIPEIRTNETIILRGEALMTHDNSKKLGYTNPRNGVAGLLNGDNIPTESLRLIETSFYEVLDSPEPLDTEENRMLFIEKMGLKTPVWTKMFSSGEVLNRLNDMLKTAKTGVYDVDGIVLADNLSKRENVMYPSNKVAFKVNTDPVKVTVKDVEWNVGRTGRITPLVYVTPVSIGGVTVSKATGFNYDFITENGIGKGSEIGIVRSGDVIPYITDVYKKSQSTYPTNCPSCGGVIEKSGVDLVCNNSKCVGSNIKKIAHFFKTMGSDYLTETTVRNLGVNTIEDMYNLDELEISDIEGFGIKKGEQLYYEIQKTLKTTPEKLLAAFGIAGIGNTLAGPILQKYTFDELFEITSVDGIPGIGDILSDNLVENINKYRPLYDFLKLKGLIFDEMSKTSMVAGMIFTLTGKMPMKRDDIVRMINSKGGFVKGISKTTNYLVTDDPNSGSNKNSKAQSYGTKIIDFNTLMDMLNE